MPSTVTPGIPYAWALTPKSTVADCSRSGVEYAYWLFSTMKMQAGQPDYRSDVDRFVEVAF